VKATAFMIALSIVLMSTGASAEVPGLMNYQGTLTDGYGVALDTTVAMTFSIYTDSVGGSQVWTETQLAVAVGNGLFNVLLGSVMAISEDVFSDPVRWLGVQVGADPDLTPRQRITTAGYAFRAAETDTADFARSALATSDGDWTIAGSDMYSGVPGHVGIGTASPSEKLHVDGNIRTENAYMISGSQVLSIAGTENLLVGAAAGAGNTGEYGTFVGHYAGQVNQGNFNTFLGLSAGTSNSTGSKNTFLGQGAGYNNTTGFENTFLGQVTGLSNTSGSCNTFLGKSAGYYNATGDSNVFIGYRAGYTETGSNKLYIDNSSTASPLIYGEFDHDVLSIHGDVGIGTMSPSSKLHVNGAIRLGSGTRDFQVQEVDPSDSVGWADLIDYGGIGIGSEAGANRQMVMFTDGAGSQNIFTVATSENNGSTWEGDFVIQQNGRVGVGTSSPTEKLQVAGTVYSTTGGFKFPDGTTQTSANASDSHSLDAADGNPVDALYVDNDGKVGVGTTSPATQLEVIASSGTAIQGKHTNGSYGIAGASYGGVVGYDGNSHSYGYLGYDSCGVYGVGFGDNGRGVYGDGGPYGVYGTGGTYGVYGEARSDSGWGVYGVASNISAAEDAYGVYGKHENSNSYGYLGGDGTGVYGNAGGYGIHGLAGNTGVWGNGGNIGVHGTAGSDGTGVRGESNYGSGVGVYGRGGPSGYAAVFSGNVKIESRDTGLTLIELGEGLDYAEGFDVTDAPEIDPGSVLIIDPDNPGKLRLCERPYDSKVAGIVAGAKGQGSGVRLGTGQFDYDVALAGRVYCNVDAVETAVEPGDLLTTSPTPGYAMKATDRERAPGAILGKAMERLEKGKKAQILVLVTLQ
jgi:hypothetical protein